MSTGSGDSVVTTKHKTLFLECPISPRGNDLFLLHNYGLFYIPNEIRLNLTASWTPVLVSKSTLYQINTILQPTCKRVMMVLLIQLHVHDKELNRAICNAQSGSLGPVPEFCCLAEMQRCHR